VAACALAAAGAPKARLLSKKIERKNFIAAQVVEVLFKPRPSHRRPGLKTLAKVKLLAKPRASI
jgi:hypothetical protein